MNFARCTGRGLLSAALTLAILPGALGQSAAQGQSRPAELASAPAATPPHPHPAESPPEPPDTKAPEDPHRERIATQKNLQEMKEPWVPHPFAYFAKGWDAMLPEQEALPAK